MKNDFNTLVGFLDRFGSEVSGRAQMGPQSDSAAKLQRFVEGACEKSERADVCEMLRLNPTWLRWVAERVKMARNIAGRTH